MVDARQGLAMYRTMLLIRTFEERVAECFAAGEIPGFIHLSVGQEAVPAGVCATLVEKDLVSATHRGHGQVLAKGADPGRVMAELFGRDTGYCHGRGGSMHVADMSHGVLGTNGIVGAAMPIAVGTALASRLLGRGQVTISFFGDGAANTGAFHEALNLASVWRLPVVFVCENNLYAEFTAQSTHTRSTSIAGRAPAYAMPGVVVDGNDVEAVYSTTAAAVANARDSGGPTLIEALTYRWRGHHEGDTMRYRPADELPAWREKDPIARYRSVLADRGWLDADAARAIENEVRDTVDRATEFARTSPYPDVATLADNVYA